MPHMSVPYSTAALTAAEITPTFQACLWAMQHYADRFVHAPTQGARRRAARYLRDNQAAAIGWASR